MASNHLHRRHRADSSGSSAGMQTPNHRDSHDLSLSPRDVTRDSLVTNMLLSLDQFSLGQHQQQTTDQRRSHWDPSPSNHSPRRPQHHHNHPFDGAPPWLPSMAPKSSGPAAAVAAAAAAAAAAASSRSHEANSHHHHAHSYSSDLDTADSSSSTLSTPPDARRDHTSTTRRTPNNASSSSASSSTTRQSTVDAVNANHLSAAALANTPARPPQHNQQQQHRPPVTPPSRGASLAPHDLTGRPPRAHRVPKHQHDGYHQFLAETTAPSSPAAAASGRDSYPPRRSKSAGGSSVVRKRAAGTSTTAASPANKPRPPPLPLSSVIDYDVDYLSRDYEAAPTPTVPAGPRRIAAAASSRGTSFDHAPPSLERKRSSRTLSLRSASGKNRQTAAPQHQHQPQQPPPPMPGADDFESAPAPHVGYRKTKEDQHRAKSSHAAFPHHQQPDQPHQQPSKEKPGFFRRVFGGGNSSKISLLPPEPSPQLNSPRPPSSPSRYERPPSGKLTKEQSKPPSAPSSRDTSSSHSHQPPPVPPLQKKTSSFFRRRKKSVVDDAPPLPSHVPPVPNVPLASLSNETGPGADNPSPVSSLRQALDPYLRNSAGSAAGAAKPSALADITNIVADSGDDDTDEPRPQFQRGFSPDYEPSPNAKIRSVPNDAKSRDTPSRKTANTAPATKKSKSAANQTFLDLDNASDDERAGKHGDRLSKSELSVSAHSEATDVSQKDTSKDDTIRASKMAPRVLGQLSSGTSRSRSNLRLPSDGNRSASIGTMSTETDYKSIPSAPPSVRVEDLDETDSSKGASTVDTMQTKGLDEPLFVIGEPTEDDRLKAKRIYDGLEDFIQKDKAAAWMGEEGPIRKRTLQAYMELYSFTDQTILAALRSICARLILRAETQQVDRILVAFSKRWCDCNPNHGFKATDVIHTICYSIMLLNTDLHVAEIESKMTRSQFVKNTLSTIRQALHETNPDAFQRPSILPDRSPMLAADAPAPEQDRSTFRHSFRPNPRPDTQSADGEDSGPLVRAPFTGPLRAWEEQIEQVLKSIYTSIRDDRLPLFGAEDRPVGPAQSSSNLSVIGMLKRTPSVLSKAPSEGQMSSRGRITEGSRSSASRWTSKSRSRPGLGRNGLASSRTSFDDDNSLWSPAMSSATWSRYSLGRTQASMSQDSFASSMPRGDYQQSIGFANALSQSIIRDEDPNGDETAAPSIISSDCTSMQLLEDESLELAGPPWIKEGMVVHKHHLDGVGKRAKDRNWSEVFAVVQKGQLSMFSFNLNKSSRHKARPRTAAAPVVGGGNWQDNAVNVGTFNLRLTLASALPSPGYSRTRPYVWALSLPTGAVHLFQVGTPEIIREFVHTANYWSARLSSHPLVGGISNVEYGWSEAIVNNALVAAIHESTSPPSTAQTMTSSIGHARKGSTHSASGGGGGNKLPGDRVHIAPWAPPTQSPRPSALSEAEQRAALAAYVLSIESDLQAHNQLRSPMLLAFTPRGTNAAKAMTNWERKSSYLLREIVKFRTYVDGLQHAETRRREVYKERELAQRAARGDLSEDEDEEEDGAGNGEVEEEANDTLRPQ